jgi:hypothetical protein
MKTILSFLSPRSGIYPGAPRPFIARSAFVLFIALAMGACATEEVLVPAQSDDPATAIVFGTFLDKAPQAAAAQSGIKPLASVLTTDGLQTDGFKVLAYSTDYTAWDDYKGTAPETPDFMNNVAVTWDTDHWTYDDVLYWPKTDGTEWGNVSFFGYSTVNGATAYGVANGNPEIAFETQVAAASQVDLVADTDLDLTAEINSGRVKFAFDHILSRIGFSAKLATAHSGTTVTVKSLKIYYKSGKVVSNGTYTFNTTTTNIDADNWELGEDTFEEKGEGEGDQIFTGEATLNTAAATNLSAPDSYLMLIPQAMEEGDVYVVLDYDVNNGSTTENKTLSIDLPATTWTPGKSYTYNFLLSFDPAVGFDTEITVNPWDDPTDIDIVPPPPYAASANTLKFGESPLIWSDWINVPDCNTTEASFSYGDTDPKCRSNTSEPNTWYYYNWHYVHANAVEMCPSPWRVPSTEDFQALATAATNGATLTAAWGLPGYADGGSVGQAGQAGYLWATTVYEGDSSGQAYGLSYTSSDVRGNAKDSKYYGQSVRCVR